MLDLAFQPRLTEFLGRVNLIETPHWERGQGTASHRRLACLKPSPSSETPPSEKSTFLAVDVICDVIESALTRSSGSSVSWGGGLLVPECVWLGRLFSI